MNGMQLELRAMPPAPAEPFAFALEAVSLTSRGLMPVLDLGPSLDRFLRISLMASAWNSTGYVLPKPLNLLHTPMCVRSASSSDPPFFSASSFTASAHSPQTHRPENRPRTPRMYSGVHSSDMPQHSHLASSTSETGWSSFISASAAASSSSLAGPWWWSWKETSETVRWSRSDEVLRRFSTLSVPMLLAIAMNGAATAMAIAHASLLGAITGSDCPTSWCFLPCSVCVCLSCDLTS
ncbi:hypothetical protein VPH35_124118 [Triticum aestivum]